MRLVIALGGNALLRRGDQMTADKQRENVRIACAELAPIAAENEVVLSHGNGPQVGLLALQAAAYETEAHIPSYPLDVLGAQTQGMIGYLLELELGNLLPFERPLATVLTMIEVDPRDPAFHDPAKFIGPIYAQTDADALAREKGWAFKQDGEAFRRVVPSPRPQRIFELHQIEWLLEKGCVVICSGGGGIPTMYVDGRQLTGVEAVIDKDHASGLLARDLRADWYVMATDVDGVYVDWGKPNQRAISRANPDALLQLASQFPAGSMGPKVVAACEFVKATGNHAAIGGLTSIDEMLAGKKGTVVTTEVLDVEFRATVATR
jgi:carbamate kinase